MRFQTTNGSDGDQNHRHKSLSSEALIIRYLLSSAAATVAETVTYPLDIVKTRLQIQNELNKNDANPAKNKLQPRGMFGIAVHIVKNEGAVSLFAGITPAVYRHLVYTGCRIVFYEQFRELLRVDSKPLPLWMAVLVGCSSGALAQFLASPTDLVKVMMQADGKRKLEGKPKRIKNVHDAFVQIYKKGGIKGLWRGSVVNVQRAALVSLGDLATYDLFKRYLMNNFNLVDNYQTHALSSLMSCLISAIMGTPADVIKTRVMLDSFGKTNLYKSSWHCLRLTVKHEGFFGLYKGFWPTWMRMAPWSLTFWVTYEEIRKICGLTGF